MPTIHVENVPEDLFEALRNRAQSNQTSIGAEVIAILSEHLSTPAGRMPRLPVQQPAIATPFPSAEQMLREDRAR